MRDKGLLGVWKLAACEGRALGGDTTFLPYGENPCGRIIYNENGSMSVLLMAGHRDTFASEDISKATDDEIRQAFSTFDAYSGRWSCEPEVGVVNHHIECARIPNWVGHVHRRFYELSNDSLTLTTEPFRIGEHEWQVTVSWVRE